MPRTDEVLQGLIVACLKSPRQKPSSRLQSGTRSNSNTTCCFMNDGSISSTCSDCLLECSDPVCCEFTAQCTDKCIVVPCTHPHNAPCDVVCEEQHPANPPGIDDFILCCDDYHACLSEPKRFLDPPANFNWDFSLDALLRGDQQQPQDQLFKPNDFSPSYASLSAPSPSSSTTESHPGSLEQTSYQIINPSFQSLNLPQHFQPPLEGGHTCMWNDCKAIFPSMEMLVSHVNVHHLHLHIQSDNNVQLLQQQHTDFMNLLSCQWGGCQVYPNAASVPGSSSNPVDAALSVLANHLYHDHLGLEDRSSPSAQSSSGPFYSAVTSESVPNQVTADPQSRDGSLNPPTPPAEHDCSSVSEHPCKWKGCSATFDTCEALMGHINSLHVGSGQKHYDCYWDECGRNGANGFPSKQKICRHLQSHTGHRPYQCSICKQNFSEAATLQQHMRRHTQEKPYVCDFPGCGKAFAITGALTIHKRTHNGYKPFKCTYCGKAFSESSNLSKHLRTHTGARPYACPEFGCGKSFARGDQLNRHMIIHKKKAASGTAISSASVTSSTKVA